MKLSVKDVSRLFNISDKTVYRWIQADNLPHYRIGGQYRFSYSELLEWAAAHGAKIRADLFDEVAEADDCDVSIATALEAGGINYRIEGSTKEEILSSVVSLMRLPESINKDIFLQFLLAREKLGSTAIGNGIAIPHVRNPVVVHSETPQISLFFLEKPVDFGALDGVPVSTIFLIVSPNIRCHLKLLAQLMFVLRDEKVLEMLSKVASRNEILTAIRNAERPVLERRQSEIEDTSRAHAASEQQGGQP